MKLWAGEEAGGGGCGGSGVRLSEVQITRMTQTCSQASPASVGEKWAFLRFTMMSSQVSVLFSSVDPEGSPKT